MQTKEGFGKGEFLYVSFLLPERGISAYSDGRIMTTTASCCMQPKIAHTVRTYVLHQLPPPPPPPPPPPSPESATTATPEETMKKYFATKSTLLLAGPGRGGGRSVVANSSLPEEQGIRQICYKKVGKVVCVSCSNLLFSLQFTIC